MHFDFHDVIVVQLAGRKRWRVWAPLERTRRPVKSGAAIAAPRLDELGPPLVDRSLMAGDCLAVPRGFPHATETIDDDSTHLTIGIMALTWERVIRRFLTTGGSGTALADRLEAGALSAGYDASAALTALDDAVHPDALAMCRHEVWRRQPRTRLRPRCARWCRRRSRCGSRPDRSSGWWGVGRAFATRARRPLHRHAAARTR